MESEIEQIEGDRQALLFALGCLWAGWRSAAPEPLSFSEEDTDMDGRDLWEPRTLGVAAAVAATLLGLFYLVAAGAPLRHLVVNLAALALGLVALGGVDKAGLVDRRSSGLVLLLLGGALLATALFGASAEGASRWIWIGPLSVQVSLVLLPFMLVGFARRRDGLAAAGLALAAVALAIQPDRAMAGALALGLAALATARRDRFVLTALLFAWAAFAMTLVRPDTSPAAPFVDQILFTAFAANRLAGAAILLGVGLLVLPAAAARRDPAGRAFGALWIAVVAAAAFGNYPTPVVGYGGSAILGYVLSLAAFPPRSRDRRSSAAPNGAAGDGPGEPMHRRSALAPGRS